LAAEWGHPQNTFPGRTPGDANPNPDAERKAYPSIRVNTLSPGHIDTPIAAAAKSRGLVDAWEKQNMMARISQKEEYRAPVLFLLAEGSSYMTGAVRVDIYGGVSKRYGLTNWCCRTSVSMVVIARGRRIC
jgi:hypothetical protein